MRRVRLLATMTERVGLLATIEECQIVATMSDKCQITGENERGGTDYLLQIVRSVGSFAIMS